MRKKEKILIAIFLLVVGALAFWLYFKRSDATEAVVYYHDTEVMRFDIHKDAQYELKGDYGAFHIEVKDGQYHVYDVDCPNHDCEKVGWVPAGSSTPIICLPNDIYIIQ